MQPTPAAPPDEPSFGLIDRAAVMLTSLVIGALVGFAAIGFLSVVRWAVAFWDVPIPTELHWPTEGWVFNTTVVLCLLGAAAVAGWIDREKGPSHHGFRCHGPLPRPTHQLQAAQGGGVPRQFAQNTGGQNPAPRVARRLSALAPQRSQPRLRKYTMGTKAESTIRPMAMG